MKVRNSEVCVDIIVPVYNAENYLKPAIESVLNQSHSNFILYLINDGSTDSSLDIIESFKDERIVLINLPENGGIVNALNTGIQMSSNEYIARFDADDICIPNRLELQVEYLLNNADVGVLGGQIEEFGNSTFSNDSKISSIPSRHEEIVVSLLFKNVMAHPTIMFRRSVLNKIGNKYSSNFPHMEDYDMWFKLITHTKFHNLDEVLIKYRVMGQNISVKNRDTYKVRLSKIHKHYLPKFEIILNDFELTLFEFGFEYGYVKISRKSIKELKRMLKNILDLDSDKLLVDKNALANRIELIWHRNFIPIIKRGSLMHVIYYWYHSRKISAKQLKLFMLKIIGKI